MTTNGQKTVLIANHGASPVPQADQILKNRGWRIFLSENAIDTFSILKKENPSVVILKPSFEPIPDFELNSINESSSPGRETILLLESIPRFTLDSQEWAGIDDFFIGTSASELAARIELAFYRLEKEKTLKNQISALMEQSITDYKTGLYNDRYILRRLVEEFQRSERHSSPLSIILADVDEFKSLNDSIGHQFGDFVLQSMAKNLTGIIRKIDIPGRYGGDEFLILLPNTGLDEAATIADRIRSFLVQHKFEKDGHKKCVTLSQGVDTYSGTEEITCDQFLKHADQAVMEAKKRGKNRIVLFPMI